MEDIYAHERRERFTTSHSAMRPLSPSLPKAEYGLLPQMRQYLTARNLSFAIAKLNGWYPSREAGDANPRVVIPATSNDSENHYWQARFLGVGDDEAGVKRYQSPAAPRGDAVVYMYDTHGNGGVIGRKHGLVVEGPMDALAGAMLGFQAIALMGVTPPDDALDLTEKLLHDTIGVLVLADSDAPQAMTDVMMRLINRGLRCRLILPAAGHKDLCETPPGLRQMLLRP